jgi:hypothetical protein
MQTNANNNQPISRESFKNFFCRNTEGGKFDICHYTNKDTGECFDKVKVGTVFLTLGKSLGSTITKEQLISMRNGLQVLQMPVTEEKRAEREKLGLQQETFILCKLGETPSNWESCDMPEWD